MPVKTIAMPRSLAAAITSSSRTEPPGWITQVAPASASTSRPSRKGKKASLATAEPCRLRPACWALMEAMRAESSRLIWPAPTPSVMPPAQKTMALLFTYWPTVQANIRSSSCCAVGCSVVTIFRSSRFRKWLSAVCSSRPEPTRLLSPRLRPWSQGRGPPGGSAICSRRTLALPLKISSASALNDGAISTSTNCLLTSCAAAPSTSRLKAMMPPKALVGSVLKALL
mmetsp:Transcript_35312/g.64174  ORF Transcript_35312/g.64174 Transcript_35312/m.64174 type:complete len:227 (-) Transcript_35312:80-760(-)